MLVWEMIEPALTKVQELENKVEEDEEEEEERTRRSAQNKG